MVSKSLSPKTIWFFKNTPPKNHMVLDFIFIYFKIFKNV